MEYRQYFMVLLIKCYDVKSILLSGFISVGVDDSSSTFAGTSWNSPIIFIPRVIGPPIGKLLIYHIPVKELYVVPGGSLKCRQDKPSGNVICMLTSTTV